MTTPDPGLAPAPSPGGADEHCTSHYTSDELTDAWMGICFNFACVNRMLAEHVEQQTGLPRPDFFVLARLRRMDCAVPLSALARELTFSSGGFTKVADRLQEAGLIERQPSPCDRRVTNAVLTPAGRAAADRALDLFSSGLRELVLRQLGDDGLRAMAGQMNRLSDVPPGVPVEQPEPEATTRSR